MAVVIPIVTTFGSKGIQNAIKQFKTLNNNMDRARFLSQRLLLPATAALAAGTGVLAKQLFDAARAAAQDEAAQKQLRLALINSTGATENQVIGVEDLIDKMARATGVADDQLRPAMGTLARATGDLTTAQQLLKLALDISAATGKPVEDVTNALGLAYLGNTKALKALGIETKNADGSTKSFKEIQEELTKLFSGAAATSANTFEGKLARLKVAFDEIKERIGKAILPYLEKFADFTLNALVPAVEKFIDSMVGGKGFKASFQQAIAAAGPFSTAMVEAMKTVTLAVLELIKQLVVAYELFKALQAAAKAAAGGWKAAIPDIAAVLAAAVAAQAIDALKNSAVDYFDQLKAGIPAIQAAQAAQQGLGTATAAVPDRLDRLEASLAKTTTGLNGMGGAANGLADKVNEAASAIRERMNRALDDAKTKLADAQNAFNDFRDNVSGAIKGVVNFGDAAQTSAERGGVSFFDALEEQANKAKEFGSLVDRLLAAGLSKEALQQVIDAGQEAGSFIAKQLLQSSENILRANKLVEETTKIALAIGTAAAEKFYQAGITNGQAYLKGIEEAIAAAEARLARKGIKVADVKGIGASFDDSLARLNQPVTPTGTNVAPSNTSVVVNTVTAPSNLGDIIVDALQDYNRRSGPLQLQIE